MSLPYKAFPTLCAENLLRTIYNECQNSPTPTDEQLQSRLHGFGDVGEIDLVRVLRTIATEFQWKRVT